MGGSERDEPERQALLCECAKIGEVSSGSVGLRPVHNRQVRSCGATGDERLVESDTTHGSAELGMTASCSAAEERISSDQEPSQKFNAG